MQLLRTLVILCLFLGQSIASAANITNENAVTPTQKNGLYVDTSNGLPINGPVQLKVLDYIEKGQLSNGLKNGVWFTYDYKNRISSVVEYKLGKYNGILINYYSSGRILDVRQYESGVLSGPWVSFYENGQIEFKGHYKSGQKNGLFMYFYTDGSLLEEGYYKDGDRDGYWLRKYRNGQIDHEISGNYYKGERIFP